MITKIDRPRPIKITTTTITTVVPARQHLLPLLHGTAVLPMCETLPAITTDHTPHPVLHLTTTGLIPHPVHQEATVRYLRPVHRQEADPHREAAVVQEDLAVNLKTNINK